MLDAASTWCENDMLLWNHGRAAVGVKNWTRVKPLAQRSRELRLQRADIRSGPDPAQRVKPMGLGVMQDRAVLTDVWLRLDRYPELGRGVGNAITEETRRCNADYSERPRLNKNCGANDCWIGSVLALPRLVTDHNSGCGCRRVVTVLEDAARIGAKPERSEVVAGDEFAGERLGQRISAPHIPPPLACLHRSQLLELRRGALEVLIQIEGEDRKIPGGCSVFGKTTFDAALVVVADAIKLRWVGHRQRPHQDRMNQREDGGIGADAQRQRKHRGNREARRLAQLP